MKYFLLVLTLAINMLATSCSSYVKNVHIQIDNENKQKRQSKGSYQNRFGGYNQFPGGRDARPIENPVTLGSRAGRSKRPAVKRDYNSGGKRRYKANELVDNGDDGSLWSGKNSESFLFVTNNVKKEGDIVIVEVMKDLKVLIKEELERAFPERKKIKKKKGGKGKTVEVEKPKEPAVEEGADDPNKIYDKISTQVIEEINNDYLLLRGKKSVVFRKAKRTIEFQAIVSPKNITDNDTVTSDKLLEPKITVLRY